MGAGIACGNAISGQSVIPQRIKKWRSTSANVPVVGYAAQPAKMMPLHYMPEAQTL
jgi:hypothetical protein